MSTITFQPTFVTIPSANNLDSKAQMYKFIVQSEKDYINQLTQIPLFGSNLVLTRFQQVQFCKIFYHIRGHFDKFLFILGSYARHKRYKDVVLQNLKDEFSGELDSHEQLYINFCQSLGVDIAEEILNESNNLDFCKKFNSGHHRFLLSHDWISKWSAFAAYERLDNGDYNQLYNLTAGFGVDNRALIFFDVHRQVEHFQTTEDLLLECWNQDSDSVKAAFEFILSHQLKMWKDMSREVLKD